MKVSLHKKAALLTVGLALLVPAMPASANQFERAPAVSQNAKPKRQGAGVVASTNGRTITVTTPDGAATTYTVTRRTHLLVWEQPNAHPTVADLAPGTAVAVKGGTQKHPDIARQIVILPDGARTPGTLPKRR